MDVTEWRLRSRGLYQPGRRTARSGGDPVPARLPVRAVLRQPAAGRLQDPRIEPTVGRLGLHPVADQPGADAGLLGLEDAFGIGSAGHGGSVRR